MPSWSGNVSSAAWFSIQSTTRSPIFSLAQRLVSMSSTPELNTLSSIWKPCLRLNSAINGAGPLGTAARYILSQGRARTAPEYPARPVCRSQDIEYGETAAALYGAYRRVYASALNSWGRCWKADVSEPPNVDFCTVSRGNALKFFLGLRLHVAFEHEEYKLLRVRRILQNRFYHDCTRGGIIFIRRKDNRKQLGITH